MKVFGCGMMRLEIMLCLAFILIHCKHSVAQTHSQDYGALISLTTGWKNLPEGWTGGDPCGNGWEGVTCINTRITTITLASMGIVGQLTGDLASLSKLQILDLSYNKGLTGSLPPNIGELYELTTLILIGCGFSGRIPDSIGNLRKLVYLSLNTNSFTGEVPATIGNLKKLYWLDLSQNQLSGSIPVSNGNTPGLDLLVNTNHFHFGMNQLSGTIPPKLFSSDMNLIHVLFDNNKLTGSIPSTLGLVQTLEAVRFDRNSLSGSLPSNLNNLTNMNELMLSNNAFTGPVPDLTGMNTLINVDMSNNSFSATDVPQWFSTLRALTTVMMEQTGLQGKLPAEFFSIPQLQTVVLRNNHLNESLDFDTSSSQQLQLIDLQNNSITSLPRAPSSNFTLLLGDNPYCKNSLTAIPYCNNQQELDSTSSYLTPVFCVPPSCTSGMTSGPNCKCAYPYTGFFILRAPSFSALGNPNYFTRLQQSLLHSFINMSLPVGAVSLSSASTDSFGYLTMKIQIFPAGQDYFNRTGVFSLGFVLSNQTYKPSQDFEPYNFLADDYTHFGGGQKSHTGAIVGAVVASIALLLLLVCAGGYAYYQKKRAEQATKQANPFDAWDSQGAYGDVPQLKGARFFTFEELRKCTNGFSEYNCVGAGGYGKVYKGILDDGLIVAIKRSQVGSMQGSREFKNEIELLSRVHHKNLVKLVGFCYDQGEQMLVYEYIANGTVLDSLSGTSGVQLDWIRRLMVTLGSARGLQYLHELADPPIIHRDIKSNNILLDDRLTAKVADFGLSRLFGDADKGYVTTQVKGTMGYLDPEYFMTNQLTEKSDVFSFGVVMLEMVTARRPIQGGKYIVKIVKTAMDREKDMYALHEVMDPMLVSSSTTQLVGFERYVDVALKCAEDSGIDRPTMGEVVKEIETILKQAGMNPNADSMPVSQSYEGADGRNSHHPYTDDSLLQYGMSVPLTKVVTV
ncbi:leucine-rich repeat receptor protein kinase HPCA1-like isoform X2 [Silene latifolia]|uniref:leucine-rich repeat receptor protein kinase HPCA1-like isoform X2 n=1 Tax=Silene latifolia TaxID=37657 RepID=UPI003D77424A